MAVAVILSRTLHETLGNEAAEAMVSWMDSVERNRAELRETSEVAFACIDARFGQAEARCGEMEARLEQRMDARFAAMERQVSGLEVSFERALREQLHKIFAVGASSLFALAALSLIVLRWGR
jgi:hypothetical protein